ncbi:MAG TPA: class I tRNA ligase family protein, partial [Terriglobales bacterium]|nr:class I tRNA ligase family protein [Terriglobales bacterium]
QAQHAIDGMSFYPEEARAWFRGIIDWLQDWPCARRTGLGTPLPWSKDWIVETLSDSTVYMAYYMISKFVNGGRVKSEQLTPETLDYIFYGTGKVDELSKTVGMERGLLDEIRNEFLYWYPVDLRNSGKDLVGNHLSFCIFQHVALFEQRYWPRAFGVNGFMVLEGKPIHKSQGNFIPLWKACEQQGADAVRCTVLLAAEGMDDPDWRADNIRDVRNRLESFIHRVEEVSTRPNEKSSNGHLENWLLSKVAARAQLVSEAVEKLKTRTAAAAALYDLWNDLRWYERRIAKPDSATMREFVSSWIRLLTPFAPHMAEEAWKKLGEAGFAASAEWPKFDQVTVDTKSDELESLIRQTLNDTQEIIATTKLSPKKVHYYTAAKWKWRVYNEALTRFNANPETLDGLIRDMISAKAASVKDLPKFASKVIQQVRTMPADLRTRRLEAGEVDERGLFAQAQAFFSKELKTTVEVHSEDEPSIYDPKSRARMAEPYRPAIFLE